MIIVEYATDFGLLQEAAAAAGTTVTYESERTPRVEAGEPSAPTRLLFWATGGDLDRFEEALERDPTVSGARSLAETDEGRLYRVEYTDEAPVETLHSRWVELDGSVIRAETDGDGWLVRMRFPDRESAREFQRWFDDREVSFEPRRIHETDAPLAERWANLTDKQAEALIAAWRMGYFDVPRSCTLADLAEELDVSAQAVSERLRRGIAAIVDQDIAPFVDRGR